MTFSTYDSKLQSFSSSSSFVTDLVTSPPLEVISSSPSGGFLVTERNNATLPEITPSIAFDSLRRTVYYYRFCDHSVYNRSLDRNSQEQVIEMVM